MNEEKTMLQKIVEQKAEQIKSAILQAVADGAEVKRTNAGVFVDGVFFVSQLPDTKELATIIRMRDDAFDELVKPLSMIEAEEKTLRERLAELEEIKERRMKK